MMSSQCCCRPLGPPSHDPATAAAAVAWPGPTTVVQAAPAPVCILGDAPRRHTQAVYEQEGGGGQTCMLSADSGRLQ